MALDWQSHSNRLNGENTLDVSVFRSEFKLVASRVVEY